MKKIICFLLVMVLVLSLLPVQTYAAKGDKLVALTFDDGPDGKLTPKLLDGLKERGVRVTFFMLGSQISGRESIVKRVYDEGHEVGNHSWNHPNLCEKSVEEVKSQITKTAVLLDKACGKGSRYLVRVPYGNSNGSVRSAIGAPLVQWSVDTNDWKYLSSDHVYKHIINEAYDGGIILCHDIHSHTIYGVLKAIDVLLARGYEFVTVSELYRRRGVEMKAGSRYYECDPTDTDLGPVEQPKITYETVDGGVKITMESPSGAPVYYSTDGSRLTQESKVYTDPFVVQCPLNIRAAAAFNLNGGRYGEVTLQLEKLPCAEPVISVQEGFLHLSCKTEKTEIYYTLDGSAPGVGSSKYVEPVAVKPGTVIRAVAGGGDFTLSTVASRYYAPKGSLFADVMPWDWHSEYIDTLASEGLMSGVGDDRFDPDGVTTRAMVVTLLYRCWGQGADQVSVAEFKDVEYEQWYTEAVSWAAANGIVQGYPDGTFRPAQPVTRQEMAHMMVNYLQYRDNGLPQAESCTELFRDGKDIGTWALDSVSRVVEAGLMQGDDAGNLNPNAGATRAEFAAVLVRMMEYEQALEQERPEEPEPTEPEEPEETVPSESEQVPETEETNPEQDTETE